MRPGGNATGFSALEYGMSGKWLELLKQIAPGTARAAVIRNPALASGSGQFGALEAVGPLLGVEVSPIDVRDPNEIEHAVAEFARAPSGGLVLTASGASIRHRDLIVTLASRHKLPAVYWDRLFASGGGLMSYGMDLIDSYRRAAAYVDRRYESIRSIPYDIRPPPLANRRSQ